MNPPRLLHSPALRRTVGRGFITTLLIIAVGSALGAVALSPVVVERIGDASDAQWQRLSNVGQAYGAASAMLSVFALLGVAVSLILQSRENRAAREQARRALHFELLKMAMDDPFYLRVWGPFAPDDTDEYREHMYANLIISHWQMDWNVGTLDEKHLREVSAVFFRGEIGYRFWSNIRAIRLKAEGGRRRHRRFFHILDQEWQAATPAEPAREAPGTTPASATPAVSTARPSRAVCLGSLAAFAMGAVIGAGIAVGTLRRRRPFR